MYIPKGQIQPGLGKSEGDLRIKSTNQPYYGFYHKDKMGRYWSGKEHTEDSYELYYGYKQPKSSNTDNVNELTSNSLRYNRLIKKSNPIPNSAVIPKTTSEPPTEQDYNKTYITRYIVEYKLTSKPVYIEVDKNLFTKLKNTSNKNFYKFAEVLWKIHGPAYDVKEGNILKTPGVISSNQRSIKEAEKSMPGIKNYLNNLTLYAVITS